MKYFAESEKKSKENIMDTIAKNLMSIVLKRNPSWTGQLNCQNWEVFDLLKKQSISTVYRGPSTITGLDHGYIFVDGSAVFHIPNALQEFVAFDVLESADRYAEIRRNWYNEDDRRKFDREPWLEYIAETKKFISENWSDGQFKGVDQNGLEILNVSTNIHEPIVEWWHGDDYYMVPPPNNGDGNGRRYLNAAFGV